MLRPTPQVQTVDARPGGYRPDIDGLRALAVLLVIGFHAGVPGAGTGFVGVDVFFVLSGYLISGIVLEEVRGGRFSLATFYIRRARRILPALVTMLVVILAVGAALLLPEDLEALGRHALASALFVPNLLSLSRSGYFDSAAIRTPLLHLWSLGVEEQFYLLWPWVLAFAARRGRASALVTGTLAASAALAWWLAASHPSAAFYLPWTRMWELALGAWIRLHDGSPSVPRRWHTPAATLALALVVAGAVTPIGGPRGALLSVVLPVLGTAALLAWPHTWVGRILGGRGPVTIGLISYPLYLWHWPLLSYASTLSHGHTPPHLAAAAIAVAFVLAAATARWVERPLRFGTMRPRAAALGAIAALACVGAIGGGLWWSRGWAHRFPPVVRSLASARFDYESAYREGRCDLTPDQEVFAGECVETAPAERPLVLVWGDSQAAHLVPGLQATREDRFRLAQFTASGCPPILDVDPATLGATSRPLCRRINDGILGRLPGLRPAVVVLSARWQSYEFRDLPRTVSAIRRLSPESRILVIGPSPSWDQVPRERLLEAFRADPLHRVPTRVRDGLRGDLPAIDRRLAGLAAEMGVPAVSLLDLLCDEGGCLARVGDGDQDLTAWDGAHLTTSGSTFVARRYEGRLLELLPGRR